jgi:hypothetical protein
MSRCEDYPACGHTDGLPCDWTPDMDHYHQQAAIHVYCDHEAGWCTLDDGDDGPWCDTCGDELSLENIDNGWTWCDECDKKGR